ncbi:hypothetical protein ABIE32_002762 [Comamonas sp. 4034]
MRTNYPTEISGSLSKPGGDQPGLNAPSEAQPSTRKKHSQIPILLRIGTAEPPTLTGCFQ